MTKTSKILKSGLGVIVMAFGVITLIDFVTKGYDAQNEELLTFSLEFQALHNAVMESYLALVVRGIMILSGALLLTKKYWFIGLLIYMPVAVNILAMHLFYDIPPAIALFFGIGLLVSVPALVLLWLERKKLKRLMD